MFVAWPGSSVPQSRSDTQEAYKKMIDCEVIAGRYFNFFIKNFFFL